MDTFPTRLPFEIGVRLLCRVRIQHAKRATCSCKSVSLKFVVYVPGHFVVPTHHAHLEKMQNILQSIISLMSLCESSFRSEPFFLSRNQWRRHSMMRRRKELNWSCFTHGVTCLVLKVVQLALVWCRRDTWRWYYYILYTLSTTFIL